MKNKHSDIEEQKRMWENQCRQSEERERRADEERRRNISEYKERYEAEGNANISAHWAKVKMLADAEESCTLEWFRNQLSQTIKPHDIYTINKPIEAVSMYIMAAYEALVDSVGATIDYREEVKRYIDMAAVWCVSHRKAGMMVIGNIGVGKTTLMKAVAATYRIVEAKPITMVDAVNASIMGVEDKRSFEQLKDSTMLAIDDLGTEQLTAKSYGNETTPMVELLTNRYNKRMFTIITTNLSDKELAERYGERMADRLVELCDTIYYDGNKKSYRI